MTMIWKIFHKTSKYRFDIEVYYQSIETTKIVVKKDTFDALCMKGCRNYNKKFSCPPFSPNFNELRKHFDAAHVIFHKVITENYPQIYNTIRMANVILKSKQRKLMDEVAKELKKENIVFQILENGSCRLCKKCAVLSHERCKHPHKMRYSLESTGVDVESLCNECFNQHLQWYKRACFPKYQGVVSTVLSRLNEVGKVQKILENKLEHSERSVSAAVPRGFRQW